MSDSCNIPKHLSQFPNELLSYIFNFLSPKSLINCRRVCKRWQAVIDYDKVWEKHCQVDFGTIYKEAKQKSISCPLWYDIYRSLSLWGRLSDTTEIHDEFCHASITDDAIMNMMAVRNGIVAIHRLGSLVYYDIETLKRTECEPFYGIFYKYFELDDALVTLDNVSVLRILKKPLHERLRDSVSTGSLQDEEFVYLSVSDIWTVGRNVYFLDVNYELFYCNIDKELVETRLCKPFKCFVSSMSFYNGYLNLITVECNVYAYQTNSFYFLFNLESKKENILDFLWQYQFLEDVDWRIVYSWYIGLQAPIPDGPLRCIRSIKVHGDVFIIGCQEGLVLIYYKPYVDGHLDFTSHTPIKRFSFYERYDIPSLSVYPIVSIDVVDIKSGHKLLIATPKKVVIVTFKHNFEVKATSTAVVPYVFRHDLCIK